MPPVRPSLVVLAAGVALVFAGCSSGSSPQAGPSPSPTAGSTPTTYDGPAAAQLEPAKVWTIDNQPVVNVGSAGLIGSSLVVTGWGKSLGDQDSVVIDRDSGSVRWRAGQLPREFRIDAKTGATASLSNLAGRPVGTGRDGLLVLPYHLGPCQDGSHDCSAKELKPYRERGLVAFSLADRSQVWHTETYRAAAPPDNAAQSSGLRLIEVVGATADVVVATVGVKGNDWGDLDWDDKDSAPLTIAYDARTGKELWRRPGLVGQDVVDGTMIGLVRSSRPSAPGGVPVGVDLRKGTTLWSMPPETSAVWGGLGAEHAIVLEHGPTGTAIVAVRLLRARDGELATLPTAEPGSAGWQLSPVPGGPLAWRAVSSTSPDGSTEGSKLLEYTKDGTVQVSGTTLPDEAAGATTGFGSYVWIRTGGGHVRAFDQTGASKSVDLTGNLTVLSADLLLVTRPDSTRLTLLRT